MENLSVEDFEDVGPVAWKRSSVLELWEKEEPGPPFFSPIVKTSFFIDQSNPSSAVPYLNSADILWDRRALVTYNTSFLTWSTAIPPSSTYFVKNLESCRMECSFDPSTDPPTRLAAAAILNRQRVLSQLRPSQ